MMAGKKRPGATAAVTGATGLVGRHLVDLLVGRGMRVRILTRCARHSDSRVEIVCGDLADTTAVRHLVGAADWVFHCAAELADERRMWSTNVDGTRAVLAAVGDSPATHFCHLSSVGVMGVFAGSVGSEETACAPVSAYEKSKHEAERLVMKMSLREGLSVVVLRPTNVVGGTKRGPLSVSRLGVLVKGGEHVHLVHAGDVAAAALHLAQHSGISSPGCFIVSTDDEPLGTLADALAVRYGRRPFHLPWPVSFLIRRIAKGPCNRGDIRFTSQKLLKLGFRYPLGFEGAVLGTDA